jgi:FkbM family methyltransferase
MALGLLPEQDLFLSSREKGSVPRMVQSVLRPGQIGVDVGAAKGEISAVMRDCVGPTGRVIAIEPRATEIPDVERHLCAIGRQREPRTLYLGKPQTLSSLFLGAMPTGHDGTLSVPVRRLDDLVAHADLVKVDVQGSEMDVLYGAPRLLRTCPAWILEVWPHAVMMSGHSIDEVLSLLASVDLVPYDVDGDAITWERVARWLMTLGHPGHHANWLCRRG